jgi:hypothetical protein
MPALSKNRPAAAGTSTTNEAPSKDTGYPHGNAAAAQDLLPGTAESGDSASLLGDGAPGTADDVGGPAEDSALDRLKERARAAAVAVVPATVPAEIRDRVGALAESQMTAIWGRVHPADAAAALAGEPNGDAALAADEAEAWAAWCDGVGQVVEDFDRFLGEANGDANAAFTAWSEAVAHAGQVQTGILMNPDITLATTHVSGVRDGANAKATVEDAARGNPSERSDYGNAPGGEVGLDPRMTEAMEDLAARGYKFRVSEITGGSHGKGSRHYAGIAFDVDQINGQRVGSRHPDVRGFMAACRELGATEVLGPGDDGHDTHIHAAWPRE